MILSFLSSTEIMVERAKVVDHSTGYRWTVRTMSCISSWSISHLCKRSATGLSEEAGVRAANYLSRWRSLDSR